MLPLLISTANHTIVFKVDFEEECLNTYEDKWDNGHVAMPCSPKNTLKTTTSESMKTLWEVICFALNHPINSSIDLEKAIMTYNIHHYGQWDFSGLHSLFDNHFDQEYKAEFFQSTLPGMLKLALELPNICNKPIPILWQKMNHSITLTQKQIACLLIHAFLCTYPNRRETTEHEIQKNETRNYSDLPSINFIKLFGDSKGCFGQRYREKLKCIFNYFRRVVMEDPTGNVTFCRQYLEKFPDWSSSRKRIKSIETHCDGFIEKDGQGMLQVDFAHECIGGLVLEHGCVQEEIRFVICPELIISRLFMERMNSEEAIIVTGAEQYSQYKGYKNDFLFDGNFEDNTPRDSWGRRCTQVAAIDAVNFHQPSHQFQLPFIKRELHKAFAGFYDHVDHLDELSPVATGNWGCGAYKGTPYLKFLIQVMAASEANRRLSYFTFGDQKLFQDLKTMQEFIAQQNLTVGNLWTALESYAINFVTSLSRKKTFLFSYIYNMYKK